MSDSRRPDPPSRPYQRPADTDNELGAWYVTTEITARAAGPLVGRRVAVKDNIEVAGVPMMNGSAAVEGYIPRRDATVVTRLLDAGATITGKAVCEDLCFSGGSHTSWTGPVRNPWDRSISAGGSSSGSAALVATGDADLALGGDQGGSVRIPRVGQMIDGNGYGMNWPGLYDPELMVHYAKGRRAHADALSDTVKMTTLCGRYVIDRYHGQYYAMARNLAFELTAAYDAALAHADVLVLPTLPIVASVLPRAGASREETRRPVAGDDRQHRSFRCQRPPRHLGSGRPRR